MNRTLTRPAATLSHPMGEGLGVRASIQFRGSMREVLLGRILTQEPLKGTTQWSEETITEPPA